jgi:ribonuclease BN (tRNA processing enzyme)
VSIEVGAKMLILDAGSGLRVLGDRLGNGVRDVFFVLSHLHRDHLDGFPFFAPLYEEGRFIHLIDYEYGTRKWSLLSMLDGVYYPMRPTSIMAEYEVVSQHPITYLNEHGFGISRLAMNHPGGAFGFRVDQDGASFVHMPDNELRPPRPQTSFDAFVKFCKGADVLSHDAMYVEEDLPEKQGWGHSTVNQVCDLAIAAAVKHLVLFHHDPDRCDDEVDRIQVQAQARLEPHGIHCSAAYEGLTFEL